MSYGKNGSVLVLAAMAEDTDPAMAIASIRKLLVGPTHKLHDAMFEEVVTILEESDREVQQALRGLERKWATLSHTTDELVAKSLESKDQTREQAEFVKQELVPDKVILFDPFPNPFTDRISIEYALPKEANDVGAVIEIYNSVGSRISSVNTSKQSGRGKWIWESEGQTSGLYFVRLKVGNQAVTQKLLKQ